MSYDEELRLKGQRVRDALKRIGGIDIDVGPAEPSKGRGTAIRRSFLSEYMREGRARLFTAPAAMI